MSLDLVLCSQGNIPCPLWIEVPEAGKELQSPTQAALWCVSGHRQFLSIPHGRGILIRVSLTSDAMISQSRWTLA